MILFDRWPDASVDDQVLDTIRSAMTSHLEAHNGLKCVGLTKLEECGVCEQRFGNRKAGIDLHFAMMKAMENERANLRS